MPWLHEKQIEDEPKDGRTEGRNALTDGVSQARVQTVGAPHQNLTAGHIVNHPSLLGHSTTKVELAQWKVLGVSYRPLI